MRRSRSPSDSQQAARWQGGLHSWPLEEVHPRGESDKDPPCIKGLGGNDPPYIREESGEDSPYIREESGEDSPNISVKSDKIPLHFRDLGLAKHAPRVINPFSSGLYKGYNPSSTSWGLLVHIVLLVLMLCTPVARSGEVIIERMEETPKINAYVDLGFEPTFVEVVSERTITEKVNVSISDLFAPLHIRTGTTWVWPCCTDSKVATLINPQTVELSPTGNLTSILKVTIEGHDLGRTAIKFIVRKNISSAQDHDNQLLADLIKEQHHRPAQLLAPGPVMHGQLPDDLVDLATLTLNGSGATWLLPYEYEVKVTNGHDPAQFYLSAILFGFMAINMIGIGGQVDGELMIYLMKKPMAISISLLCRFGIIPAVSTDSIHFNLYRLFYESLIFIMV